MADYTLGLYPIAGTGAMYNGVAVLVDGAGNTYVAFGNSNELNTNETWADVYKYAQGGAQLEHHTVHAPAPYKVDGVSLTHSGGNLVVGCNLHTPGTVDRRRAVASVQIPGYIYRQGMETEEGAAGAYSPNGGNDVGITIDDVKAAVREVVGIGDGRSLGDDWGAHHQPAPHASSYDWRQVLEDKNKSALTENGVLTTTNVMPTLFQFIKDRDYEVFAENVPGFWPWLRSQVPGAEAAFAEQQKQQAQGE